MNKKIISTSIAFASIMMFAAGAAMPAFAQTSTANAYGAAVTTVPPRTTPQPPVTTKKPLSAAAITNIVTRAFAEINRRITSLGNLASRINQMQNVTTDEKNALTSSIGLQVTGMQNLETKIKQDEMSATASSSLKDDIASITKGYRIYMLIIPQGAITAAGDRELTVQGILSDLESKLQQRLSSTTAPTSAATSQAQAALADMTAKLSDASTQAQGAIAEVAPLQPDNGDNTILQQNNATLQDGRTKIKTGQQDLIAARKDAVTIIKDLGIKASAAAGL